MIQTQIRLDIGYIHEMNIDIPISDTDIDINMQIQKYISELGFQVKCNSYVSNIQSFNQILQDEYLTVDIAGQL